MRKVMIVLTLFVVQAVQPGLSARAQNSAAANSEAYPNRPVMLITPSTGGASDAIARIIASALTRSMNAPFVVDAHSGAGGNIATEAVARAPADGHTLLLALNNMLTINPVLYRHARFNPIADFEPVALLATSRYLLVANAGVSARNVKELVDEARAKPKPLLYASSGYGTPSHLMTVLFSKVAGVELQHVPYRGISRATADLLSGQVQLMGASISGLLPLAQAGKLKALGVTGQTRSPLAPDVPTIAETIPGFEFEAWYALLAPAKTPRSIVDKLAAAAVSALDNEKVRGLLVEQGAEADPDAPAQLKSRIRADLEKWTTIVKEAGLRID
jgi:tripartite-type tricarboxylate transporter receptor subunit TctC